jgi:hypothetical protein
MPKRVDANQSQIAGELRQLGFLVFVTSDLGGGFPDLVVGDLATMRVYLFEVKNPARSWTLTPAEEEFHDRWAGLVRVIESTEQALEAMGRGTTSSMTRS